jgi:anti-sigma factor RsiW
MNRPSDEVLMAYADGALDTAEANRVAVHLETDAEARRLVEQFRRTSELAHQAFDIATPVAGLDPIAERILAQPLPERPDSVAETPTNVVPIARITQTRFDKFKPSSWPIAASIALAVGIGIGVLLTRIAGPGDDAQIALGEAPTNSPLAQALERQASGVAVGRILVVTTFQDRLGRACREVEILSQTRPQVPVMAGVACRLADGRWIVEGAARIAEAKASSDPAYLPSGADEKDALASLLAMIGAKTALSPAEEKALIARSWIPLAPQKSRE